VSAGLLQQLDLALRRMLPFLTALLAVLVDLLPLPAPGPHGVTSFLTLGVVYFWSLYRPDLLAPGAVFVTGLVYDALAGLPLGLSALALLLARYVMVSHQRFFVAKSFLVVWCCFVLLAVAVEGLRWAIGCLWWGRWLAPMPLLLEIGLTVALYPCLSWLLIRLHGQIPRVAHAS
jgi:rod shape-determining protein MreD